METSAQEDKNCLSFGFKRNILNSLFNDHKYSFFSFFNWAIAAAALKRRLVHTKLEKIFHRGKFVHIPQANTSLTYTVPKSLKSIRVFLRRGLHTEIKKLNLTKNKRTYLLLYQCSSCYKTRHLRVVFWKTSLQLRNWIWLPAAN